MKHVGYLEKVWREGNSLYGSIRLTESLPWPTFQVLGHLDIQGFTYPDKGMYRLRDLVLGPSKRLSIYPEWSIQTDVRKVGLFQLRPYGVMRDLDLDAMQKQIEQANEIGVNFSVRITEGDEECCEDCS